MATSMESNERSRYTDVLDEPVERLLSPIREYEDKPLLPLAETIKFVSKFFNHIEDYVYVALHNCQNPDDNLTQDESASIYLYTMQFHGGPSLHQLLNQALRDENREQLIPWFPFLKLLLTALHKLPSGSQIVWRGMKGINLSSKYKTGAKIAWWGVSSCTTNTEILESNRLLGHDGSRTLFSIQCSSGKSLVNHSYYKSEEEEVILVPGSYFQVIEQSNPASELHIIQLKEIIPPITFSESPTFKSTHINPSSISQQSNTHAQTTSNMTKKNPFFNIIRKLLSKKANTKLKPQTKTIAGGNGQGHRLNQLDGPWGISMDNDQTIYVADCDNHRIVKWKCDAKQGRIVAGGNKVGDQIKQLNQPTDVIIDRETNSLIISDQGNRRVVRCFRQKSTNAEVIISDIDCARLIMDKNGSLYVSDWKKDEVRRWNRGEKGSGTVVAGGNGEGDQLSQLNDPTFIFVDEDESVYVSDMNNNRVMKWVKDGKEGVVVAGGNGQGDSLRQLSHPQGILVDRLNHIYVVDWGNHRVMRWCEGATEGTILIGGNGEGQQSNQLNYPRGLSFDRLGNLCVADWGNARIQKFAIE